MSFQNKRRMFALGRMKRGHMNKTEIAYSKHLDTLKTLGEIEWYRFEGIKLRLADNTFFTPDFFVMRHNGQFEAHEVKGFWMDDARVKIKCAADQYPIKFIAIMKVRGEWHFEEF